MKRITFRGSLLMMALMISLPAWAGTYLDNFDAYEGGSIDNGNLGEWVRYRFGNQTAEWFVKNGELVSTSKDVCSLASPIAIGNSTWTDYEFEFQFKLEQHFPAGCANWGSAIGGWIHVDKADPRGTGLGVFVRTNPGNPEVWGRFGCERFVQGQWTSLADGNFVTMQGVWYTVRIIGNGNQYQMFIDDQLMCGSPSDSPDSGGVMLFARNCEVHFDNLRITGDTIPDNVTAVDSKAKLATTWGQLRSH